MNDQPSKQPSLACPAQTQAVAQLEQMIEEGSKDVAAYIRSLKQLSSTDICSRPRLSSEH